MQSDAMLFFPTDFRVKRHCSQSMWHVWFNHMLLGVFVAVKLIYISTKARSMHSQTELWDPTENTQQLYSKIKYACHIRERPLNLANKIKLNLEQKQVMFQLAFQTWPLDTWQKPCLIWYKFLSVMFALVIVFCCSDIMIKLSFLFLFYIFVMTLGFWHSFLHTFVPGNVAAWLHAPHLQSQNSLSWMA